MQKTSKQLWKNLLRNNFLLFFILAGCTTGAFTLSIDEVTIIDQKYTSSISDYQYGLTYFDRFAREVPSNNEELLSVIQELETLKEQKEDSTSVNYIDLRIKLFEAERLYKSGSRRPFAGYDSLIRCSKSEEIILSIDEVREAITLTEEAVTLWEELTIVELPENWDEIIEEENKRLEKIIRPRYQILTQNCTSSPSEQV